MNKPLEKFQSLLRELFQFDCADLDFGIYRIMNHKRGVIERFITQDLPADISKELDRGALADQSQAAVELQDIAAQIENFQKMLWEKRKFITETQYCITVGNIAVIRRETTGWKKADYERDKKCVAEQKLTEGADEVFVNGDSFIPNARALEPIFKARMFAPVEA
jgi:hypothetical protein